MPFFFNVILPVCLMPLLAEPMCNMTWDGWLCWDETKAGVKEQNCPDYFDDFDTHGKSLCPL